MMKKAIFTLITGLAFGLNANAQYVMKITKVDGTTITVNADDVESVTFSTDDTSVALTVEGTYEGWTSASAAYFSGMNNDGDKVELSAASATTVDLTYTSQTWGTATFKDVTVSQTDEGYTLSTAAESTILMPGMGGGDPREYACTFEGGSISADLKTYSFVFRAPAVMGGTTMTFQQGTAPDKE